MTHERFEVLMVKVVDDTATAAEREELMSWITDKPELRAELDEHRALKALTDGWVQRLEVDLAEDRARTAPIGRVERGIGVALLLTGFAVLSAGGVVELFADPTVPLWVRIGMGSALAGSLLLLFGAARWRLKTRKHDRYTEVVR